MKKPLKVYSSENDKNIRQIVAYKDGILQMEEYTSPFEREHTMQLMSVTKSITSLLVGIAIDKGYIGSADDYVMDYYKDTYTPKSGENTIYQVKIKHLLTMTAPYRGKNEPWAQMLTSKDWTKKALCYLGGKGDITNTFRYHTPGMQILLGIVALSTKMSVLDFANEYLFKPLGIEPRVDAKCRTLRANYHYLMNKYDHGKVWLLDPAGTPSAGWGLSLSAYEMAQIGLMVLGKGVYNGQRVVSEQWIAQSTTPYISTFDRYGNMDYGYLWWFPHRDSDTICAIGDGGNIIYISKPYNIVVAINGYLKADVSDRVEFIEKNIVPALCE